MKIKKLRSNNVIDASILIYKTFKKYNSSDFFNKKAIIETLNYFDIKKNTEAELITMFKKTPISFAAFENNKMLGVIRGTENKVTSLMVDGKYQYMGIGKKLLLKFESEAIRRDSGMIRIKSSLVAVRFYESMGYKKTTGIRNFMGLKVYNMKKELC